MFLFSNLSNEQWTKLNRRNLIRIIKSYCFQKKSNYWNRRRQVTWPIITYSVVEMKKVMLNSGTITNFWLAQRLQSTHSALTLRPRLNGYWPIFVDYPGSPPLRDVILLKIWTYLHIRANKYCPKSPIGCREETLNDQTQAVAPD